MYGAPGDDGGAGVSRTIDHNTIGLVQEPLVQYVLKAAIIDIFMITMYQMTM